MSLLRKHRLRNNRPLTKERRASDARVRAYDVRVMTKNAFSEKLCGRGTRNRDTTWSGLIYNLQNKQNAYFRRSIANSIRWIGQDMAAVHTVDRVISRRLEAMEASRSRRVAALDYAPMFTFRITHAHQRPRHSKNDKEQIIGSIKVF